MRKAFKPNQAYIIDKAPTRNVMDEAIDSLEEKQLPNQEEIDLNRLKQKLNSWHKRSSKKQ